MGSLLIVIFGFITDFSYACNPDFCKTRTHGQFYCDPASDRSYYQCFYDQAMHFDCQEGLIYSLSANCDWPHNPVCVTNPVPDQYPGIKDPVTGHCNRDPSMSYPSPTSTTSATSPTSASPPTSITSITSSTSPSSATSPTSPTSHSSATSATSPTSPTSATSPTSLTSPSSATSPTSPTSPTSATSSPSSTSAIPTTQYLPGKYIWGIYRRTKHQKSGCDVHATYDVISVRECGTLCYRSSGCTDFNFSTTLTSDLYICELVRCTGPFLLMSSTDFHFYERI